MIFSPSQNSFTIACVIDQHARFYTELILWAECVYHYLPSSFKKVVYFVERGAPDVTAWLHDLGIETKISEKLIPASPHCNKIAPFLDEHNTDYVIVTDADLFFVADPSPLFRSDRVRAAPNNHCNPPPEIFKTILAAAGMIGRPYRPGVSLFAGDLGLRETHINNVSGGIVAMPALLRLELASAWLSEARWLTERQNLLGRWSVHVDQVALCLAMERLGLDIEFLPPQVNCILHLLPFVSTVLAFHLTSGHIPEFAEKFGADRTLTAGKFPAHLSESIARLNDCIVSATKVIRRLPTTRDQETTFLNPQWKR